MKLSLACLLALAPTSVLAQVSGGASLSAQALTQALNTSPAQAARSPAPRAAPVAPSTPQPTIAAPQAEAEALTRALNQARPTGVVQAPAAAQPQPATAPAPAPARPAAPARETAPAQTSAPKPSAPVAAEPRREARPQAAPSTNPVQATPAASTVAPRPVAAPAQAAASNPSAARPTQRPTAPVEAKPVAEPPAQARPDPAALAGPVRRDTPVPGVLNAAAIAALPFEIDLPAGVQLVSVSTARNAQVWALRKGPSTLAMIFAGAQSQYPIFEGEQVTVAGRTSVVLTEGIRRIAVEHLFQRDQAPQELHIWLMAQDGADRDLAERIAQTLDYR